MADYRKVRHRQRPRPVDRCKIDGNFWSKFIKPTSLSFPGAVLALDFSPAAPHDALITASARVSLVSGRNNKVVKAFSRISGVAYSGTFRPMDGRLIGAGDDGGAVSVFDVGTKASLRHMKGHKAASRVVRWRRDGLALFSGSDDKTVKYWDLATGQHLTTNQGHRDYIRCGTINPASQDVFISGSYDHTLCMWDMRSNGTPVSTFNHGSPVEACLVLPGGSLLLSAGSDTIKVWDLLGRGHLVHSFSNHAKTVTCLATDLDGTRLLSASLDGHVKVYDVQTYDVVHSLRFSGPLLSVGLSPDKNRLMVGRADGTLSIRRRGKEKVDESTYLGPAAGGGGSNGAQKPIYGGTTRYFQRGKNAVAGQGDFQVELHKRQRLAAYDVSLKGFRYHEALDKALDSRNPRTIVAVMEELIMRRGLRLALTGRDEAGLEPLMAFLARYINHPDFSEPLSDACHMVLDLYAPMVGQSQVLDELLGRVSRQVKAEVSLQKELLQLVGTMDMVMATQEYNRGGQGDLLELELPTALEGGGGGKGKKRLRMGEEGGEEEEEEEE